MYSKGQRVAATVKSILSFSVFVRLEDGTCAYIRRGQLTLSDDRDPCDAISEER